MRKIFKMIEIPIEYIIKANGSRIIAFEYWISDNVLNYAQSFLCDKLPDLNKIKYFTGFSDKCKKGTTYLKYYAIRWDWEDNIHLSASIYWDPDNSDYSISNIAYWDVSDLWLWKGDINDFIFRDYFYNGRDKCYFEHMKNMTDTVNF